MTMDEEKLEESMDILDSIPLKERNPLLSGNKEEKHISETVHLFERLEGEFYRRKKGATLHGGPWATPEIYKKNYTRRQFARKLSMGELFVFHGIWDMFGTAAYYRTTVDGHIEVRDAMFHIRNSMLPSLGSFSREAYMDRFSKALKEFNVDSEEAKKR